MQEIPLRYIVSRYIGVLVLTLVAFVVIIYILEQYIGIQPNSGMGIVATLVPALDAGQAIVNKIGHRVAKNAAWKLSAILNVFNFLISGLLAIPIIMFDKSLQSAVSGNMSIFAIVVIVMFFVTLMVTRYFIGMGMTQGEKRLVKQNTEVF